MFFITSDKKVHLEKNFLRIFTPSVKEEKEEIVIEHKENILKCVFYNCKKVILDRHTIFISGIAFPSTGETLVSALIKVIQNKCLSTLNGNFNLIILDKDNKTLSIVSDRYGSIPVFFSEENRIIKISPAFQFFLLDKGSYEFNEKSLLDYVCLGYTLPEESFWNSIRIVPKKKILLLHPDKCPILLHDTLTEKNLLPFRSLKECAEYFYISLKQVIQDEIDLSRTDKMFLTGGSDTRILLSCINEKTRKRMKFITFYSPPWSPNNDNDVLISKMIADTLNLNHEIYNFQNNNIDNNPYGHLQTHYSSEAYHISGMFGTELFGGKLFRKRFSDVLEPYIYSDKLDKIKKNLTSLLSHEDYKRIGSPWERLNKRLFYGDSENREEILMLQTLFRSQFTSLYSCYNVSEFMIPYLNHFQTILPYMDTRIIDVFVRSRREYLERYNLYEYVLKHFCGKKLLQIPFCSSITSYVEGIKNVSSYIDANEHISRCNYKLYFEKFFKSSLFKGTFLNKLSNADSQKISEPFLHRICDLNSFLLGLENR